MGSVQSRLQDQTYKNWVKAGLCLALVKEGLEDFADMKSKEFHRDVLARIANIQPLNCTDFENKNITFIYKNQGTITCNHQFCEGFLDAIVRVGIDPNTAFTLRKANIDNCDVKLWYTDPWELSKLFMNPGQLSCQTNPSQTDLSGILNFLDHCQIARSDVLNSQLIAEVRQTRNCIMHTSDMKVSNTDFKRFTQSMINLLSDPKTLAGLPSAQKSISEIQRIRQSGFQFSLEEESKIIQELSDALRGATECTKTEMKDLRALLNNMLQVQEEQKEMAQRLIKKGEKEINKVKDTFNVLKRRVSKYEKLQKTTNSRINELHKSLEEAEKEVWTAYNDLKRRLEDLEADVAVLYKRQANIESQVEGIKTSTITEEDCRNFRMVLVDEYTRIYKDVSLSPIYESQDVEALRIPVDKVYCKLQIVKLKGNLKIPLDSYKDLFGDKQIKNVIIKGEGGTGKSTWCKRILHAWCQIQRKALGMPGTFSVDEETVDMEKALEAFAYLLYVPLRHVKHQAPIKDILFSAGLKRLSKQKNVCEYVLAHKSVCVLILLDGFDEYPFRLDSQGLLSSTLIMTTRPWKYEFLCAEDKTFKVDAVVSIQGLTVSGVHKLANKVIASYNKGYPNKSAATDNDKCQTEMFLEEIKSAKLSKSIEIPLILIITVLTWLENKSLSRSLTFNILDLLKVIFVRSENKLSPIDKIALKRLQLGKGATAMFKSRLTAKYDFMSDYQELLMHLGHLAFKGLADTHKDLSLVFTENQLHNFLKPEELDICYKLGLLTKSVVTTSLLERTKVSVSFYHKLIQELFAALFIVSNKRALSEFKTTVDSCNTILEMENVILFITGLNPSFGSELSEHFVELFDTDDLVLEYRGVDVYQTLDHFDRDVNRTENYLATLYELLFKCILECEFADISDKNEQNHVYLTDIRITEFTDIDERICLHSFHSLKHLKSLAVVGHDHRGFPFTRYDPNYKQITDMTTLAQEAPSLQFVNFSLGNVRYAERSTTGVLKFDLSENVNLKSFSIEGIPHHGGKGIFDLSLSTMTKLRRVKLSNVVMNTTSWDKLCKSFGSNNKNQVRQNEWSVKFTNVIMPFSSWFLFCQSLKTLKDVNVDLRNVENDSGRNFENRNEPLTRYCDNTDIHKLLSISEKCVELHSVTMCKESWLSFFQSVQSIEPSQLILNHLDIHEASINMENSSLLEKLILVDVKVREIKLPIETVTSHLTLQLVIMSHSSWNRLFQSLTSANIFELKLKELDIAEATINLENSWNLRYLELEDLKVSEIKLPPEIQLDTMTCQSVTMPLPSWRGFWQKLKSACISKLHLENLHIDEIHINLENSSTLKKLDLENVKVNEIILAAETKLHFVRLKCVSMKQSTWNRFFQSLHSADNFILVLKNLNVDEMVINLENTVISKLELENVKISRLKQPTRLESDIVRLQSISMPQSSWTTFFQSLQSFYQTELILTNLDINDITINLVNIASLRKLEVNYVKVSDIKLPTGSIPHSIILQTVIMPQAAWSSFFQSLQSFWQKELILKHLNIEETVINLENISVLRKLELENVKVCEIKLGTETDLQIVKLQSVTMSHFSWKSLFQTLKSCFNLELKDLNITINPILECRGLKTFELENVKVNQIELQSGKHPFLDIVRLTSVHMPQSFCRLPFLYPEEPQNGNEKLENKPIRNQTEEAENGSAQQENESEENGSRIKHSRLTENAFEENKTDNRENNIKKTANDFEKRENEFEKNKNKTPNEEAGELEHVSKEKKKEYREPNDECGELENKSKEVIIDNESIENMTEEGASDKSKSEYLQEDSGKHVYGKRDNIYEDRENESNESVDESAKTSLFDESVDEAIETNSLSDESVDTESECDYLYMTELILKNLNIDEKTINVQEFVRLRKLYLDNVKVNNIILPTDKDLKTVRLQSVSMPPLSWCSFFQLLRATCLTELTFHHLTIAETTINLMHSSELKKLELEDVRFNELILSPRMQFEYIKLKTVTMPLSSWSSLFRSLQSADILKSPYQTELVLRKPNIDGITINLQNSFRIWNLELADIKIRELKLPALMDLDTIRLQSVTMPQISWNSVCQSLQSTCLTGLILDNLNIGKNSLRLKNCKQLKLLEISKVRLEGIELLNTDRLETAKIDTVEFSSSQYGSFINTILHSRRLTDLRMKNINITDKETLWFGSCLSLESIRIEDVTINQESYESVSTLLDWYPVAKRKEISYTVENKLLNVVLKSSRE